jgi:hypothetical protein
LQEDRNAVVLLVPSRMPARYLQKDCNALVRLPTAAYLQEDRNAVVLLVPCSIEKDGRPLFAESPECIAIAGAVAEGAHRGSSSFSARLILLGFLSRCRSSATISRGVVLNRIRVAKCGEFSIGNSLVYREI